MRAFNEWQSTASGGWLPPPPPPSSFQFQVPVEVLQYAPYPPASNEGWKNSTKKNGNLWILKTIEKKI